MDRDASFFGPILPQAPNAPEAFTFAELRQIRDRRREADTLRAAPQVWPDSRRETMLPPPDVAIGAQVA